MKWPWSKPVPNSVEHQKQILEEVRQERGKLAVTVISLEHVTNQLDEIVRRSLAELHRGSIK